MSGKPAFVRKREVTNIIKAAKQQGAARVTVRWRDASADIHLSKSDDADDGSSDVNEWDGAV